MDNNGSFNNFNNFKKLSFGENFVPPKFDEQTNIENLANDILQPNINLEIAQGTSKEEVPKKQPKNKSNKKENNSDKMKNFKIRVAVYFFILLIILGLIFNQTILNVYFINKANKFYAQGDYMNAFKNFKSAFATNVDNSNYAAKYFSTMDKLEFYPVVQKELIKLKKDCDNPKVINAINDLFEKHRKKILEEAGLNYIDHTPTNSNIIHWNPLFRVVVKIDKNSIPSYYVTQIIKAFKDWSIALDNELNFEFNDEKKPHIEVFFVDSISGASEQYGKKIEILGSTEPFYTGGNLIKTKIKFKKTDIDGSTFTENQIYNLALHEIGHAIGIAGHSYNKNDVMYPTNNDATWANDSSTLFISKKYLTTEDRNTVKLFYKIIPNITNYHKFNEYQAGLYYPEVVLGDEDKIAQKKLKESQTYMTMISGNYISYMDLGEGYFATKNYKEARNAFLSATKLAKDKIEFYNAYYNLAVNAYESGDYKSAVEYGSVANTYIDDNRANEVIGFAYIKLKKLEEAQNQFEELVKENPDNAIFSYTLADIYFSRYNFFKGLGEIKRIKSANPEALYDDVYRKYKIIGMLL